MKQILSILIVAVIFVGSSSVYTVHQGETAILLRLGEIVKTNIQPGLHFKTPFVNSVKLFDARLQTLDAEPERYLTKEKKNLIIDSFVKWRIKNPKEFYTAMNGNADLANIRLAQILKDGLRAEFGNITVQEAISLDRTKIVQDIIASTKHDISAFGIEIVDVRVKKVNLPQAISKSVYKRMEAERYRVAKELRAEGEEAAEKIKADADRQRIIIVAKAYKNAQIVKGQGDADAAEIYAKAYNLDPKFYAFYKSINAYKTAFNSKSDMMIVDPKSSDFFKYFNQQK